MVDEQPSTGAAESRQRSLPVMPHREEKLMAEYAIGYRQAPPVHVLIHRRGGPKRGVWEYRITGKRAEFGRAQFPCAAGGTFRQAYLAARRAVVDLFQQRGITCPVTFYPRPYQPGAMPFAAWLEEEK